MNSVHRWLRFNLVGGMGMALQLGLLACITHFSRSRYLLASTIAVETAVVHNFLWHVRYTWRDRLKNFFWPAQLLRFHVSNGIVSIAGNLVFMRLLVKNAHLPLLVANILSIACCSIANFFLSDAWAFGKVHSPSATNHAGTASA